MPDVTINGKATWDSVAGAAAYDVISEELNGAQIAAVLDITATETPILGLLTKPDLSVMPPGTYRFKVRSQDAQGNQGEWSPTFSFTMVAPPAPLNLGVSE